MKLKKIVALALVACLSLGLTGCIGNFYENAIAVDGTQISSGMYLMIQMTAYNEAKALVEVEEDEEGNLPEFNVLKEKVEGKNGKQWIAQRTEELCRRYVLVDRQCLEKEITLSEEGRSYLEQTLQYWSMLEEHYMDNGIDQSTFMRYLANESLSDQLFLEMYSEDGELAPTDEEMKEEYSQKNAHIRFISIPLTMSDEDSTDKTDEVGKAAETMLASLKSGKALEEVAKNNLPAVYKMLGREFDPETVADTITTSYIAYEQKEDDDTYTPEFLTALKDQTVGDYGTFTMSSSLLLYQKAEVYETEEDFINMRDTVVKSLYSDAYDEYLASIYNTYKITRPAGSALYFRPSKVVE